MIQRLGSTKEIISLKGNQKINKPQSYIVNCLTDQWDLNAACEVFWMTEGVCKWEPVGGSDY